MKKVFLNIIICITLLVFIGCAGLGVQPKKDYTDVFSQSAAATRMYGRATYIGGTKSVDNIAYAGLVDGDLCIVGTTADVYALYRFDDDSGAAENSPYVIEPDDAGAGNGRWILLNPNISELSIAATANGPQFVYFLENSGNGANYVGIGAPDEVTNDLMLLIPGTADPLAGQVIKFAVPTSVTGSDDTPRDSAQGSWSYAGASLTPVVDTPANFAANFTLENLYGGTFIASAAGTAVLPAVAVNMNFIFKVEGDDDDLVIIDPNAADTIYMNGLAAAQDENIVTGATSRGHKCEFKYRSANSWTADCSTTWVEDTP